MVEYGRGSYGESDPELSQTATTELLATEACSCPREGAWGYRVQRGKLSQNAEELIRRFCH